MKNKLFLLSVLVLALAFALVACAPAQKKDDKAQTLEDKTQTEQKDAQKEESKEPAAELKTIKVGATPLPHAEILEFIKPMMEKKGYVLEIVEFTDYVTPNLALDEKAIDANFFQHTPYMDSFAKERNLKLVNAGGVHVEPMGVYSKKIKSIDELKDGDVVAFPNDATNGGRALMLLEKHGLIKLSENAGLEATEHDIVENPKNLKFQAIDAPQLPRTLEDVTISAINSNYALEAGLNPATDSLIKEGEDSPYVNIITVLEGNENNEEIKVLVETLQSEEVKNFINEKYQGAISPAF